MSQNLSPASPTASIDALWKVINALSLETDFEQFVRKASEMAASLVNADAAALVTVNETNELEYLFFFGLDEAQQELAKGHAQDKEQGITGRALREKKPVFVPHYASDPQAIDAFIELGLHSNLVIPIVVSGLAIGALTLSWLNEDASEPDQHTIALTETITAQIGLALQRTQLEKRLTYRANHDDLTKLPSRGYFLSRLEDTLSNAKRHQRLVALMVIDLDGFKAVNDQAGHAIGDELLCAVALRLNSVVRGGDLVGRLGGDEFVVMLEYQEWPDEPMSVAERILEDLNIEVPGTRDTLFVTPSIGLATYPEDASDATELLKSADLAMYQAKQQFGGNQLCLYNQDTAAAVRQRKEIIANISTALKNNHLIVHYQPVVNTETDQITTVEALVRWQLPDGSLRDAKEFITTVERHGPRLTLELGRHVLRTTIEQAMQWQRDGLVVDVSVNISAREFLEDEFLPSLESLLLAHTDFPPERLILEVSETGALEDTARASRIMNACRNLGVRFNIDNFGSGQAALSCLRELPVDFVKINRSFVQGITESERDKTVMGAIITLARAFGVDVIAEGVETAEHVNTLREIGCHLMQGYYFSKALPPEVLAQSLAAQR